MPANALSRRTPVRHTVCGVLLLSIITTSRRFDYLACLAVTALSAAATVWTALELGLGWGAASLGLFTLMLVGATYYARLLWKREPAMRLKRTAVKLRTPR